MDLAFFPLAPLRNACGLVSLFSAFLLIGSIRMLWLGKGDLVAVPNNQAESLKISCPCCGVHIQFATQNLGQQLSCPHCRTSITLRKPDLLKMACEVASN